MTSHPFKGVGTALVTPFRLDGAVDHDALKHLVDFQIAGGVDMIIPCGTTGEAVTLSDDEYEMVVGTVVDRTARKILVVAGAGSNATTRTIRTAEIAKNCGVDGVLIVGPYYNKPTQEGFFQHFKAVSEATKLPMIIYNVPGRTSSNIEAATQVRISTLEYVVATKEASGNFSQVMQIIKTKPESFAVLSGDDNITIPLIAIGAEGVISVISNEMPKEFSEMVHAALRGDWDRARQVHYTLLPLMEANFIESNPIPVKAALAKMGKITEAYRLPLVPMNPSNKERLYQAMKQSGIHA
jgi:4-hydroxy-tetrahydrodipicolinate synthase